MPRLLLDLIDVNEDINYSLFVTMFCSYIIILWLIISVWVGMDAWKRYGNKRLATLFCVLTFLLNFPMLILYFIIRPEERFDDLEEWNAGGVNVPIVNFTGKDGVEMMLELKIHPSKLAQAPSDMKIDVSWESPKEQLNLAPTGVQTVPSEKETVYPKRADRQVTNIFSNIGGLMSKKIKSVKEVSASYVSRSKSSAKKKNLDILQDATNIKSKPSQLNEATSKKKNKKKKKKRR